MAVTKAPQTTKLVVKVQTGLNAAGNPVYRLRSFANVKSGAADSDVYAVGLGLASLQKYPAVNVARIDEANLISQ